MHALHEMEMDASAGVIWARSSWRMFGYALIACWHHVCQCALGFYLMCHRPGCFPDIEQRIALYESYRILNRLVDEKVVKVLL